MEEAYDVAVEALAVCRVRPLRIMELLQLLELLVEILAP